MYYFYCPNCKYQNEIKEKEIPKNRVGNCRDGYGIPIYHFKCPKCSNLDAGCMVERYGDNHEKLYYQEVIEMYQDIRTKHKEE